MHVSTLIADTVQYGVMIAIYCWVKKLVVRHGFYEIYFQVELLSHIPTVTCARPVPLSFNNQHSRGGNYLSGPDIQVILS